MSSKEYFDTVASVWDNLRKDFFSETVREKAYQVAGVELGKTAADIGAGTVCPKRKCGFPIGPRR
ncbi:hypothetical protein [Desulfosporosinus sp. Sb-LF]|uniref:hypothetical protein n=1 Tax=Desulfosporosinus sp. Sb-LF TaxID=2560027 RepID=UPI001FB067D1|nr:hypothetical protein [Desulfosporosinus sp. Sb-LF]